jgi:uncharacterized protein YlxW (UPF0749 family)
VTILAQRIRSIPSWQVTLGVALLVLGFLIAAQLAGEGPRVRYTSQERSPLVVTVEGLQSQQEALKQQLAELRGRIQDLERQGKGSAALVGQLNDQLQEARIAAGLIGVTGTGVVVQLEDSTQPTPASGNDADYLVTARDVRTVVEQLWLAGAEAVSVNGERVTTSTAIIDIGGSVLVNSAYLVPPYQISAIGSADLWETVSRREGFTDFLVSRSEAFGIRVSFLESDKVDIPPFQGPTALRYARTVSPSNTPAASARPAPTGSAP